MSLTLDGPASSQIAAAVRGAHWLIEMDFTTGTERVTTAPLDITGGGNTYVGLGNLVEVAAVAESEDSSAAKLTIGITAANSAWLALAVGSVDTYRGQRVRLYLQLLDETFQPVGAMVRRWGGYMDKVQITRRNAEGGAGGSGRIELQCSRAGMARLRKAQGLRHTHAQQLQRFPGDMGLEYMQTLIEQPSLWISKKFQEV